MSENDLRLGHPAGTAPLTGSEHSHVRLQNGIAEIAQSSDVRLRLPVGPHAIVHCGNEQHGRSGGEQSGREQITRLACGRPRHEVGGCRRDDHGMCLARQTDVVECMTGVEQPGMNLAPGQTLESERANEFLCPRGKYHVDLGASLRKKAREPSRLVAGNPAGNAEDNASPIERTHGRPCLTGACA